MVTTVINKNLTKARRFNIGHFQRVTYDIPTQLSRTIADEIRDNFRSFLDNWHSRPETFDDALDSWLHRIYADVQSDKSRKVWPPRNMPYFSPSSANSDPRELYEKVRGAKRERTGQPPHQGRWTRIGTSIGDLIQRDILLAEKHVEAARFRFERNDRDEPMFEDFAKVARTITVGGTNFALYGTCDGIMTYVTEDGEQIRVGLEIKSKQTTFSQTSEFSQRNGPKDDHVKQTICYSVMYDKPEAHIDYYVILYVNASKKAWEMTTDEYEKNPDIAVHVVEITDDMRTGLMRHFTEIVDMAGANTPPPLDLTKWTFNNLKQACAVGLSTDELAALERQVDAVKRSGMKEWQKQAYVTALDEIKQLREVAV